MMDLVTTMFFDGELSAFPIEQSELVEVKVKSIYKP